MYSLYFIIQYIYDDFEIISAIQIREVNSNMNIL